MSSITFPVLEALRNFPRFSPATFNLKKMIKAFHRSNKRWTFIFQTLLVWFHHQIHLRWVYLCIEIYYNFLPHFSHSHRYLISTCDTRYFTSDDDLIFKNYFSSFFRSTRKQPLTFCWYFLNEKCTQHRGRKTRKSDLRIKKMTMYHHVVYNVGIRWLSRVVHMIFLCCCGFLWYFLWMNSYTITSN